MAGSEKGSRDGAGRGEMGWGGVGWGRRFCFVVGSVENIQNTSGCFPHVGLLTEANLLSSVLITMFVC